MSGEAGHELVGDGAGREGHHLNLCASVTVLTFNMEICYKS